MQTWIGSGLFERDTASPGTKTDIPIWDMFKEPMAKCPDGTSGNNIGEGEGEGEVLA